MTSVPPPGSAAELDALRRRAYGPDADIDTTALARLRELERQLVGSSAPTLTARQPAAQAAEAVTPRHPETPVDQPARGTASAAVPADESEPEATPGPRASRQRRASIWIAAGVVAAVVAVAGIVASVWSRPESTLTAMADTVSFPENLLWLPRALGMPPDRLRAYDGPGEMVVWAGTAEDGVSCVLVTALDGPFGFGCSRDEPTADVVLEERMASVEVTGYAPRTTMRFVYTGGRVEVWVDEPAP